MLRPTWARPLLILLLLVVLPAAPAGAEANAMQRVRTDSPYLRLVIASGIQRSPTFRAIVERLERSDLIVEVQCGRFIDSRLAGRTMFLTARPAVRYVLVEISCPVASVPAPGTIGHELSHALEIASARWVVDGETLARLYGHIGFPTFGPTTTAFGQYETADALDAGERVHQELFHSSEPTRRLASILIK